MQETDIHHLLIEHSVIVFVVCAVLLMAVLTIIGIKLMNFLDKRSEDNLKKKE